MFKILGISNLLGQYMWGPSTTIYVQNYAFIQGVNFHVVEISDPENMTLLSTVPLGGPEWSAVNFPSLGVCPRIFSMGSLPVMTEIIFISPAQRGQERETSKTSCRSSAQPFFH